MTKNVSKKSYLPLPNEFSFSAPKLIVLLNHISNKRSSVFFQNFFFNRFESNKISVKTVNKQIKACLL